MYLNVYQSTGSVTIVATKPKIIDTNRSWSGSLDIILHIQLSKLISINRKIISVIIENVCIVNVF